mmetsp:Transcript_7521/g.7591  ORF Transcript_7521/g.7591 Transcript_7521/m.7591 type:complete len:159 (-) Transcript_7521:103-579(-)|eukprot:CAMPEP_0119040572 /NCGR_PEP_ID=MMETSP1177-20130426/10553_1 /TAXON_ID=2985 /ORGANISM="Ochromonas sp, Strain CCMP1899" /LENGTH=158 /DNA_ID=CAMNT_0007005769 /DNA_START=150 /DNA_END=626 /DNA_ORIENTATION=+
MDDEDMEDWETTDLDLPSISVSSHTDTCAKSDVAKEESEWDIDIPSDIKTDSVALKKDLKDVVEKENVILILVDLTVLSNGNIHNKFDKFSVNDQDAKKKLCDKISKEYKDYANNSKLIMDQTVRHCSELVWRDALESLRTEFKGHYWFPFFPPKEKL